MPKEITFKLNRDTYVEGTTLGKMIYPDGLTNETLEDICRAWGIKHGGSTAIPVGRYRMTVSMSSKFNRKMVMIYTESNQYEVKMNGIGFKGIRVHGGQSNKDSWGCVIVAKRRTSNQTVQGSCEAQFTAAVESYEQKGYDVYLEVKNLPQKE